LGLGVREAGEVVVTRYKGKHRREREDFKGATPPSLRDFARLMAQIEQRLPALTRHYREAYDFAYAAYPQSGERVSGSNDFEGGPTARVAWDKTRQYARGQLNSAFESCKNAQSSIAAAFTSLEKVVYLRSPEHLKISGQTHITQAEYDEAVKAAERRVE
jgi:hypothetical protein